MTLKKQSAARLFSGHFGIEFLEPELDLLKSVISEYSKIPYENLTKIINKFSRDDFSGRMRGPEKLMEDYINSKTGGTCFSLTFCLGSILSDAGFICYPAMADMKKPNIHCALIVGIDNKRYVVDPGYLLGEPLELAPSVTTASTPFGFVELRPRGGIAYDLYTVTGSERKWRYRLKTVPVSKGQFMEYWKDSFSQPMMNSLQLTRLSGEGHLYIRDHHLRLRSGDKKMNENIRNNMEIRIESEFGIPAEITARARGFIERKKESWRAKSR
ncbi:arylamine N-acetyltransferase [bacterium]|nr:arylamine N-acetyltransferase [bacterium]